MSEKRVVYTRHAPERLAQRGITFEEVRHCVLNPDRELVEDGVRKAIKKMNDRVLIVVYRFENDDTILVITAYKSSKVEKYLHES